MEPIRYRNQDVDVVYSSLRKEFKSTAQMYAEYMAAARRLRTSFHVPVDPTDYDIKDILSSLADEEAESQLVLEQVYRGINKSITSHVDS